MSGKGGVKAGHAGIVAHAANNREAGDDKTADLVSRRILNVHRSGGNNAVTVEGVASGGAERCGRLAAVNTGFVFGPGLVQHQARSGQHVDAFGGVLPQDIQRKFCAALPEA